MLRVTRDGKQLWMLTSGTNHDVLLDPASLKELAVVPTGRGPVQQAFGPAGGRFGLVAQLVETWVLAIDHATLKPVAKIEVGGSQGNISFTPDGTRAFVTVTAANEVAVIDMSRLALMGRIKTGGQPTGLVVV